jgi:hypothetical protein
MPKKGSFPESPLQSASWPFMLEQDLAIFLTMLEDRFRKDRSDPLPAFEALSYVAAYVWRNENSSTRMLPIPWWVVQALAIGFSIYRDSAETSTPMTLGESFNLEGRGQGKEPRVQRAMRELRDIRIATAIALARAAGGKIEAALQDQAQKTRLSIGQVERIWEKNREQAVNAVHNLQTRKTS